MMLTEDPSGKDMQRITFEDMQILLKENLSKAWERFTKYMSVYLEIHQDELKPLIKTKSETNKESSQSSAETETVI
jgi:hypothetical protein